MKKITRTISYFGEPIEVNGTPLTTEAAKRFIKIGDMITTFGHAYLVTGRYDDSVVIVDTLLPQVVKSWR